MLHWVNKNREIISDNFLKRGFRFEKEQFDQLEKNYKISVLKAEQLRATRNALSEEIKLKKQQKLATDDLELASKNSGEDLKNAELELKNSEDLLNEFLLTLPNLLDNTVPFGKNEQDNVIIKTWGEPRNFNFKPKDHIKLGEDLAQIDFATAAKLSGSRFVILKNNIARVHRALIQFMLDVHTQQHHYQEIYIPYIVKKSTLYGTGHLPKFEADQFRLSDKFQDYFLISTAEQVLSSLHREAILDEKKLPLKYVAHSPCFRSEAGSYGKDVRGMIRNHQFEKVELVQFVTPEKSDQVLEEIVSHAEKILQLLELPYRVMLLCSGDTGASAAKTYDLEVWLPSANNYREISSCSNDRDFQACRMQGRYRLTEENNNKNKKNSDYFHTLNGSGLAVGRTLVAILENYQDAQGNIIIPKVLHPYLNNLEIIKL